MSNIVFPNLILFDRRQDIVDAWTDAFSDADTSVIATVSDFRSLKGEMIVSPANSFGFMNGGIDYHYSQFFDNNSNGDTIQNRVQQKIKDEFDGELLVGQALSVYVAHAQFSFLIVAPTMRLPMKITDPADVFLATRAALRIAVNFQNIYSKTPLTILFPGMGTGAGMIPPDFCADHMRKAYDAVRFGETFPESWEEGLRRTYGPRN